MTFTPEQIALLDGPLNRSAVKARKQSGRTLSYIEGWHAIAEANRIFGFDAWCRETIDLKCVNERPRKIGQEGRDGWGVSYVARVMVRIGDVIREGTGAGHGIDTDLGLAHESAVKEAETDAMKRALMTFGNPFGLALYDKTQADVVDDTQQAPQEPRTPMVPTTSLPHELPTEDEKKKARAIKFGTDAIEFVRKSTDSKAFEDWHRVSRDTIARVADYDKALHAKLIEAINMRRGMFAPT